MVNKTKKIIDKDLLIYLYQDCNLSGDDIGKLLICSDNVVYTNLRDYGIRVRKKMENKRLNIDKDLLEYLYLKCELGLFDIGKMLNCGSTSINEYLDLYSIPRRSMPSACSTEVVKNKKRFYVMGDKNPAKRPEVRKKISETMIRNGSVKGEKNPSYGKIYSRSGRGIHSWYTLPNGLNIWVRSTYERRIIECLISSGVNFIWEPPRWKLEHSTYTTDCYLVDLDTYIEIKGYLHPTYKMKYAHFLSMYPDVNIRIIFLDDILDIESIINDNDRVNWKTVGKEMKEVVT